MATKLPAKQTAEELQIDSEVASEIISEYFALIAKELACAKQADCTNLQRITALEAQLRQLKHEKMNLSDEKVIHRAVYTYAPILRDAR